MKSEIKESVIKVKDIEHIIIDALFYEIDNHWITIEYCCGIVEIGDFEQMRENILDALDDDTHKRFKSLGRNTRIRLISKGIKTVLEHIISANRGAFYIASTASPGFKDYKQEIDQTAAEMALRAMNFKSQGTRKSPSTGSKLTLWILKG